MALKRRYLHIPLCILVCTVVIPRQVSGQDCTLCYLGAMPTVSSETCTLLAEEASALGLATEGACIELQKQATTECGCPPVPEISCSICDGSDLPFPDRIVYRENADPITCSALEQAAKEESSLCGDLSNFAYYCECPDATLGCTLCPSESPVFGEFENRELKGYRPDWVPADFNYTCIAAQALLSVEGDEAQCSAAQDELEEIALLCGCFVPDPYFCASICPDGSLVDPDFRDDPALTEQPIYVQDSEDPIFVDYTCREYELRAAEGTLLDWECDTANYIGVKKCGCAQETERAFCDLCDDGSIPADLTTLITYRQTCLGYAGLAYGANSSTSTCDAFQGTGGIYCGCKNAPTECRICDVPFGEVVPDPSQTIVDSLGFEVDCGELEFLGNFRDNPDGVTCEDMIAEGNPLCCDTSSTPGPTVAPTPDPTPDPTLAPTPPPTEASTPQSTPPPTQASTPQSTPPPTVTSTMASTPQSTPPPTETSTMASTPEPTPPPTVAPTMASTPESTPPPTVASTPVPTSASTPTSTTESTQGSTPAPTVASTPSPTLSSTTPPTPDPTATPTSTQPTSVPTTNPTPSPTSQPTPVPTGEQLNIIVPPSPGNTQTDSSRINKNWKWWYAPWNQRKRNRKKPWFRGGRI